MGVKIFLSFLIIIIVYGLWVFLAPDITSRIDAFIWFPGLTENIRGSKEKLDYVSTDGVNSTLESVKQARESAREVVDTTKEHIDTIREQAANIEQTVQEIQWNIDTIKEVYESTTQNIEQVSDVLKSVSWWTQSWVLSE